MKLSRRAQLDAMRNIIQRETFADATAIACSLVLGLRPTKEELSDQRALLLDNELPSHVCEMAGGLLSDAMLIVRKSGCSRSCKQRLGR